MNTFSFVINQAANGWSVTYYMNGQVYLMEISHTSKEVLTMLRKQLVEFFAVMKQEEANADG